MTCPYLDSLLYTVTRPARYTGGEWNHIIKDWDSARLRFVLAYPDLYEVGMSNMALPILYELLNRQHDVLAERVFAPWVDMQAAMRARRLRLVSLESKHPLGEFDVIGFSLGYELTYTNILSMLDLAGIPLFASERGDSHPLVIAGGTAALNPEPLADFIDLFVIGDGEEAVAELLEVLREAKGKGRSATLRELARLPGFYVPSLYRVEYDAQGRTKSITPLVPEAPARIERRIVAKLPPPVTRPVVPYIETIHDRGAIEISRGCTRGCRFCHAGVVYRPVRERAVEEVVQGVDEILAGCGYDEISLVSLSTSDYSHIEGLVTHLTERYQDSVAISLPSLRINTASVRLIDALSHRRKSGLTFAPEAGSKRLQQVINKVTSEDVLMETAVTAFESGWTNLKLYFMIGLPTETLEDVQDIVELVARVSSLGERASGKRPQVRVSLGTYVPKPHTPFQWVPQESEEKLNERYELLRGRLRRGIKLSWQDPKVSLLEAVVSRGDRRLGRAIYTAWKLGAVFDAWGECFSFEKWRRAFEETGLDPAFYAHRQRPLDEYLPWSHIRTGLSQAFLKREYRLAQAGIETPDCREGCTGCGLQRRSPACQQRYRLREAPSEKPR